MFKRSPKYQEANRDIIKQFQNFRHNMIKTLAEIFESITDNKFDYALGQLVAFLVLPNTLEKLIQQYFVSTKRNVFETSADLTYSLEDFSRKSNEVCSWLGEISQKAHDVIKLSKESKNKELIVDNYIELNDLIVGKNDNRFLDFIAISQVLGLDFQLYLASKPEDRLNNLFNDLKLHPIITKASNKLFRDNHYSQAIFEACKSLNMYVQKKSKRDDIDGSSLMSKVFSLAYDKEKKQMKRNPILQLNELNGESDRDEQSGFKFLFMGAMMGIRNPKAHELIVQKDPFRTLAYLSLLSLLATRVDEAKLNTA